MTNLIGIFDSGIGGLSVLKEINTLLPSESLFYIADQVHIPYGLHSKIDVQKWSVGITHFLLEQQVTLVVVACNTASAAALDYLRQTFPYIPFVGMEPAIKSGVHYTQTNKIGILATAGTFRSQRYVNLIHRFAQNIDIIENPCLGLVELIEVGHHQTPELKDLLQKILLPMLDYGVDTIVLGCTHYPFVITQIREIVGENVTLIDPSPSVAQQVARCLPSKGQHATNNKMIGATTGDASTFAEQIKELLRYNIDTIPLYWHGTSLKKCKKSLWETPKETKPVGK